MRSRLSDTGGVNIPATEYIARHKITILDCGAPLSNFVKKSRTDYQSLFGKEIMIRSHIGRIAEFIKLSNIICKISSIYVYFVLDSLLSGQQLK